MEVEGIGSNTHIYLTGGAWRSTRNFCTVGMWVCMCIRSKVRGTSGCWSKDGE